MQSWDRLFVDEVSMFRYFTRNTSVKHNLTVQNLVDWFTHLQGKENGCKAVFSKRTRCYMLQKISHQ